MASRAENQPGRTGPGNHLGDLPRSHSIFTDPTEYDLSNTQYGAMFLPLVVTAIATSLLGARLADRFSSKQVLLVGLAANITAMVLLVITSGIKTDPRRTRCSSWQPRCSSWQPRSSGSASD